MRSRPGQGRCHSRRSGRPWWSRIYPSVSTECCRTHCLLDSWACSRWLTRQISLGFPDGFHSEWNFEFEWRLQREVVSVISHARDADGRTALMVYWNCAISKQRLKAPKSLTSALVLVEEEMQLMKAYCLHLGLFDRMGRMIFGSPLLCSQEYSC